MAGDTHLSIGEVLVLLQEDFPDVTISKIRFLESQGLLDPDRTPSGYRKFYDADIAKLRWILRQQREHFLPLKVIKERLEEAGGEIPADEHEPSDDGLAEDLDQLDDELDLSAYLDDEGGVLFGAGTGAATDDEEGDAAGAADDEPPAPQEEPVAKQARSAPARSTRGRKRGRKQSEDEAPAEKAPLPRSAPAARPAPAAAEEAPGAAEEAQRALLDAGPTDMTLTPEELAAAAGLTQRQLGELVAYGMLAAPGVAGLPCYDGDDLVVARVAAGFLAHGVEARHLKRWKAAAEAEAGLYEQVIMPALRSGDGQRRADARTVLAELVELGDQLRGALLREALGEHLR